MDRTSASLIIDIFTIIDDAHLRKSQKETLIRLIWERADELDFSQYDVDRALLKRYNLWEEEDECCSPCSSTECFCGNDD